MFSPTTRSLAGRDRGFTLVELLVVVILAAVAVPVFLNQRKKAIDAGLKADIKSAVTAQETWITDHPHITTGTQTPADFAALGFKASHGSTIMVSRHPVLGGYCIFGYNPNSSKYNDIMTALMGYDSTNGGFLPYVAARDVGGTGTLPTTGSCGTSDGGRGVVTYIS